MNYPHNSEQYSDWQRAQPTRPVAPGVGMVVAITLFFGVFGLIPASSRANEARRMGYSARPYWASFWWTFGAVALAWIVLWFIVIAAGASAAETYQACVTGNPDTWTTVCVK